ncbi:MAG: hypothetical protein DMF34_09965 [Verrucomicrobia bacterium]|nr:MAG: hypothetical protein DMF34_09965 [Verrucomicrobiota bacterium]
MKIPQKLKEYLDSKRAPLPPIGDLNEPLQLDSLALIRLVAFLESDLGIRIEDDGLVAENFETLGRLGDLIASKSKAIEASEAPKQGSSSALP